MKSSVNLLACAGTAWAYDPEIHDGPVWGINNCWTQQKIKPTVIIAMDDLQRDWRDGHRKYVNSIVNVDCQVVTARAYPRWPTTRSYPLSEVILTIWGGDVRLASKVLGNTCSYAIALAIIRNRNPIRLFGFEFVNPDKPWSLYRAKRLVKKHQPDWFRFYQKPMFRSVTEPGVEGVLWLLGYAAARGIDVWIPETSTLLNLDRDDFFYGYQEQPRL